VIGVLLLNRGVNGVKTMRWINAHWSGRQEYPVSYFLVQFLAQSFDRHYYCYDFDMMMMMMII